MYAVAVQEFLKGIGGGGGPCMHGWLTINSIFPFILQLDFMALSVLTPTQMKAVEYVTQRSRKESEALHRKLKARVVKLGYSEDDLAE